MISLLQTTRRLQSILPIRSFCLLSPQSSSDISKFINRTSALEKEHKWTDISEALSHADNKEAIIQKTFSMCAENIECTQSQTLRKKKLWHTNQSKLSPCTFHTLINATSIAAKNLDQLTALLNATKADSRVASMIGVTGLFDYYKPFLPASTGVEGTEGGSGGKPDAFISEIESRIMGHFFQWIVHMDEKATMIQSQLLFNNMHFLHRDDWSRMLGFIDTVTNSSTVENSASLSAYDFLASMDSVRATSFSLAAYEFLAAHDIVKATIFLKNAKQKGHFPPSSLTVGFQYSDLVLKSIPLAWPTSAPDNRHDNKRHTLKNKNKMKSTFHHVQGSVEVDVALAAYINKVNASTPHTTTTSTSSTSSKSSEEKSLDLECIKNHLDNLFYLAEGSTHYDKLLRHTFYKNLLHSNRPRTLISYETQRRAQERQYYSNLISASDTTNSSSNSRSNACSNPLLLDLAGYSTILRAQRNQQDIEGMFATLSDWNQMVGLIATSPVDVNSKNIFVTPDSSVYRIFLSFFHLNPDMITEARLERFFEQMQLDNVTPDKNKDIISLFKFASKANSCSMTNTLLDWVETLMADDDGGEGGSSDELFGVDSASRSDGQPSYESDIIHMNSAPKRAFQKSELVQIYDYALETNSMEMDNGDKCLDILFTMKNKNIVLNGNRIAFVMKAFKNSKNFAALLELFHSMVALGVNRDTYHVSLAVVAYLRTEQVAKGLALLERFEAAGQDLKGFAYFAAAFEILRRLCMKPYFIPIPLTSKDGAAGGDTHMQRREATIKCVDLFLRAIENEDMYPASKNHLKTSFRLLDTAIYEEMIEYLEQQTTTDTTSTADTDTDTDTASAVTSDPSSSSSSLPLAPPANRLLQLFKELRLLSKRGQGPKQGQGQGQEWSRS